MEYIDAEFTLDGFRRSVSMKVTEFNDIKSWLTSYRHSKGSVVSVRNADIARMRVAIGDFAALDPSIRYHLRSLVCAQWKISVGSLIFCWTSWTRKVDGVHQLSLPLSQKAFNEN